MDRLSAGNQSADIAILRDAGKCFEAVGEGDHIMSAIFDELRYDSLNRAARIDQHNALPPKY
jgi:hypothetical protein